MLSIKEFCEKSKMSEAYVRALLRDGKLEGIKVGKQWRIPGDEANKFLGINDVSSFKRDLYIKDLEGKVKRYELQLSVLKNAIKNLTEIVDKN